MGFLHFMMFVVMVLGAPLLALLAMSAVGVVVKWLQDGVVQPTGQGPPPARARGDAPPVRRVPHGWGWALAAAGVAAVVWVIVYFPDKAEFRHLLDKASGYAATRIDIALREDTAENRQALVHALAPTLRAGGRTILYQVSTRSGSYVVREEVPAVYRFAPGRLEIAMGGVLQGDALYTLQATLGAAGTPVPQQVAADVQVGDAVFAAMLALATAAILSGSARAAASQGAGDTAVCRLEMRMTLGREQAGALLDRWRTDREAAPRAVLRSAMFGEAGTDGMRVVGVMPASARARPAAPRGQDDGPRTTLLVGLRPPGLDPATTPDCGRTLLRGAPPMVRAALLAATMPAVADLAAEATVHPLAQFTPWYTRHRWTRFPSEREGAALGTRCGTEERRRLRLSAQAIEAGCNSRQAPGDAALCARLDRLVEQAREDQARCEAGDI